MNKKIIIFLLSVFIKINTLSGATCFPAENLWRLLSDTCSALDNIDTNIPLGSIYDALTEIDVQLEQIESISDTTKSKLDTCCYTLSSLDAIIKLDVDAGSTKIDSVSTQIATMENKLDICCNHIEDLYTCALGTAITQSMIPYTITTPGNYYLYECINSNDPAAITIATNNVRLNLNGNTITTTGNYGITCSNVNNVFILNGSIIPAETGLFMSSCNNVGIYNITCINGGDISIDLQSVTDLIVRNCTIDGTTSLFSIGLQMFLCKEVTVVGCASYNQTGFGFAASTVTGLELVDCTSVGATFYIAGSVQTATFARNCVASNSFSGGFTIESSSGAVFQGCIARSCTQSGFITSVSSRSVVYERCISDNNGENGFECYNTTSPVYESCIANNNSLNGFYIRNVNGSPVQNATCERCLATNNAVDGFKIDTISNKARFNRCIAAGNANRGFNNLSATTIIVDSRSEHVATPPLNPSGYNLNGVTNLLSGATEIIIS